MRSRSVDFMTMSNAIHSKTFWLAIVSAILTVAVTLGVPLSAAQEGTIESAVAIIVAMVLGGSAVSYAHAKAAAAVAQAENVAGSSTAASKE